MSGLKLYDNPRGWTYEYISVGGDWTDGKKLHGIVKGGSIERIMTAEKESGTLEFASVAELPDDGRIRIYATDSYTGNRVPLATMRVTKPKSSITSALGESADVDMLSVLTYVSQDRPTYPYSLAKGTNIVNAAKAIFTSHGLKVNAAESSTVLSEAKVYESDDDWLTIANDLLTGSPNFASAYPDRYGTVQLQPYAEPGEKSAKVEFSDTGDNRIRFVGSLSSEDDWYSVPNRLVLTYEKDESTYRAVASDYSGTRLSYDRRGYWVTEHETASDMPETGIQAALNAKAKQLLLAAQSNVAAYEFQGEFVEGLELSDSVRFNWTRHGIDDVRSVYSMKYNLTRSLLVDYRLREYMRGDGVS